MPLIYLLGIVLDKMIGPSKKPHWTPRQIEEPRIAEKPVKVPKTDQE